MPSKRPATTPVILKVQRSLSGQCDRMLIYNEARTLMHEGPITGDIADLLGTEPKVYVKLVRVRGQRW